MRFRRPYQAAQREPEDCSAADLGCYVKVGQQFTAIPPVDYPSCDDVSKVVLRELGDNFRPLWTVQHWKSPNGGIVRICLHVLGSYLPVTKDRDPRRSGLLAKNILLPTTGNMGIDWKAPIYNDDVLDGLSDNERLAGVLPRYERLDMETVDAFRFHLWKKRHAPKPLSAEAEKKADAVLSKEEDEKAHRAHVDRLTYAKRHDRLNTMEVDGMFIPPDQPVVFLNQAQEGAA